MDACKQCPLGYAQSSAGQTSCIKCSPGEFNGDVGVAACEPCAENTYYGDKGRNSSCMDCPTGWSSDDGSAKCQACGAGTFGNGCNKCPLGFARKGDDIDATQCRPCPLGETTTIEGAATCSGCDLGSYGKSKGTCSACPAGQYQDGKGETSCKECGVDTYLIESGKSSNADCTSCTLDRSTGKANGNVMSSACLCKRTEFYQNENNECEACPTGGNCSAHDGLPIMHLYATTGHWQPHNTTTIFIPCSAAFTDAKLADAASLRCCPEEAHCHVVPRPLTWTPNDQCQIGYAGVLCTSCASNYVLFQAECIECNGGSEFMLGVAGLCGCSFILFMVTFVLLKKINGAAANSEKKSIEKETIQDRVSDLISITVSWLQILSSMTITYKLSWPSLFVSYSQGTGVVANLEFGTLLTFSNCHLAVPFINKFLLQVMGIPLFIFGIFLAWLVVKCTSKKGTVREVKQAQKGQTLQLCILIVQLLYPKLSTFTFQMVKRIFRRFFYF